MKWRNPFFQLLDLIRLESSARHVALGAVLGMLLGLTPVLTLHWGIFFVLIFIVRTNLVALALSGLFFQVLGLVSEPFFHWMGNPILTQTPGLRRLWAGLYHAPILTFTRFNNTVVMGCFLFSCVAAPVLYVGTLLLWKRYGTRVAMAYHNSALGISWSSSALYRAYAKHRSYYR